MAVSSQRSALSLGQRLWNSLSAWAVQSAGYQKYGGFVVLSVACDDEPFYVASLFLSQEYPKCSPAALLTVVQGA